VSGTPGCPREGEGGVREKPPGDEKKESLAPRGKILCEGDIRQGRKFKMSGKTPAGEPQRPMANKEKRDQMQAYLPKTPEPDLRGGERETA